MFSGQGPLLHLSCQLVDPQLQHDSVLQTIQKDLALRVEGWKAAAQWQVEHSWCWSVALARVHLDGLTPTLSKINKFWLLGSLPLKCGVGGVCCASLGLWKDQTSASWRRYNQKGVYYLMSKARWWNILDTLQDAVETPWRKSLCKVVSKGEGSLEDLEPDGSTKSNL